MRVLVIDPDHTGLDLCLKAVGAGHEVKLWQMPKGRYRTKTGDGFKMIEKVAAWQPHMPWAKNGVVINLFNERKITAELDRWRSFGSPVFGPSVKSSMLEWERGAGMKFMQEHGVEIPAFHTFKTLDECIRFAWKAQDPFVFKTAGDVEDKSLSYVASDPADLVSFLEKKKADGLKLKGEMYLQKKIDMIAELGVSAWMGKNGFLPDKWNVNFEHKKLMADDYGPSTGEQGCYSADTEVLTDSGWKFWPNVSMADKLATLVNGHLEFESPSAVVCYDSLGTMVQWKNRSINILVTPNHNMYVCGQGPARQGKEAFKFVQAEDCTEAQYLLARTAKWNGTSPEVHRLAGNQWDNGVCIRKTEDVCVPFGAWARFLGLWFAEGCASRRNAIYIAQSHPEKSRKAEEIIQATGLRYRRVGEGFAIGCAQAWRELHQYGKSFEKRVPAYIKAAHSDDIAAFLDGFALGDAHTQKNGSRLFYTSNPGLADDLQELMLRCGRLGVIKQLPPKKNPSSIEGRKIVQRRPAFVVYERARKITGWLDKRDREIVEYMGKVYCATVSSHVLYVRRGGKPVWCGNTVTKYVKSGRMADVLRKFEASLVKLGHIGDFDIGCGIDASGKVWPFEFSARFGFPSTPILMACHTSDPIEWMRDAATTGKDTLTVDYQTAMGVIMTRPPYPNKNEDPESSVGYRIDGLEGVWDSVCPIGMMIDDGPTMDGSTDGRPKMGRVFKTTDDCICTVTALGPDVHDVIPQVYAAIEKIKFSDRQVRNDVGKQLEKELPKLHALGFDELPQW